MKKKIVSVFLTLSLVLSVLGFNTVSVSAMTAQEGANWALSKVGQSIDVDGYYGAQCVDLVKRYCIDNWGWSPRGNAKEYVSIALPNSSWTRIKNTPEFIPQPGDIAIWSNGTYGHVAIIISANINSFVSVDQNWYNSNGTTGSPAAKVTHNYSGFWGVIRPPFSSESTETNISAIHSDTNATVRNGFFTIKNCAGLYMNVKDGIDANKTPINMLEYDDSTNQNFNIVHKGNGKYKLYAYSSSLGTNRVVDIFRNGQALEAGQVVDLYDPNDDTAQLFYIVPLSDGSFVFELASKDGYVIAPANGNTANGTQLTLQRYTGANYQKWKFCNNNGYETHPFGGYGTGTYTITTGGISLVLRSGAGTGYNKVCSIPDETALVVTAISDNWGYTSYNGNSGWICLDFTSYTPTITSISVSNMPHTTTYCVGDELDTTDMVLTLNYSNGSTKNITNGFTTSYNFNSPGKKTVTVTYEGKTTSFEVDVVALEAIGMEITNPANKLSYYVGDTLDTTGLTLDVAYNNGSHKTVTSGFDTECDLSTAGTKTVTISYDGLTATYEVNVSNIGSASVSTALNKTAKKGDEVTFAVNLSNAENAYDGNFNIVYDNTVLKYKRHTAGESLANQNPTVNPDYDDNKLRVSFAGSSELEAGNMVNIVFEVIATSSCNTDVSVEDINMYNILGKALSVSNAGLTQTCAISVTKPVIDENATKVTIANVKAKKGNQVEVTVDLANNTGFSNLAIEVGYDSDVMTLISATSTISGASFTTTQNITANPYNMQWDSASDVTYNGTLATLTFTVKDNAPDGVYPITVDFYKGRNGDNVDGEDVNYKANYDELGLAYINGELTVFSYIPGDLNGDGKVNNKDATEILRYFANWTLPELVVEALDVDGNGKVNNKDATHLLKYFANWDVELH